MIGTLYRATRRSISDIVHSQKRWDREQRLSVAGVFDFALNTRTKREMLKSMSTTSVGTRKRFSDGKSASLSTLAWNVYFRGYMDQYADKSDDNEIINRQSAIEDYLLENTIPELIECNVLQAHIKKDGEDIFVDEIEELIDLGLINSYSTNPKAPSDFDFNFELQESGNCMIIGARPGDRYEYTIKALKSVHDIDAEHDFFVEWK